MSFWDDIKDVVCNVAPVLATVIESPALAIGASIVGKLLCGDANALPHEVAEALKLPGAEQLLASAEQALNDKLVEVAEHIVSSVAGK